MKIKELKAREILDSLGRPTIEAEVFLADGSQGIASIPSGMVQGKYEARELRDKDPARFDGWGVLKAVEQINQTIAPKIIGRDAAYQAKIDAFLLELDGTADSSRLGANTLLAVSQAVLEASAFSYQLPIYAYLQAKYGLNDKNLLPTPIFNMINGGQHGAGNLDFQEFHLIPSQRQDYPRALECGQKVYQTLKNVLIRRGSSYSIGDEGGFTPNLFNNLDALEILTEAVGITNYQLGRDVFFGLDVAAASFYQNGEYLIKDRVQPFSQKEMIKYYFDLNSQYPLFSLEDPLQEDDWSGWIELTSQMAKDTLIIADDLVGGAKRRIQKAIKKKAANAVSLKLGQRATIGELVEAASLSRRAGWKVIISHRSGETNDDFLADLAVGLGADYVKFGPPARGERIVKYNRLAKIDVNLKK